MNQKMAMMKNKGLTFPKVASEFDPMMIELCAEPSFDSFCSILIFEVSAI